MPTISGTVYYDRLRIRSSSTGIAGVPVCLYDPAAALGVVALTSSIGMFMFSSVPNGNYILIECYGASGRPSPVSYATAAAMEKPAAADPPISMAPSPAPAANKLDSLSPNTLFITVAGLNVLNQNFYDGPLEERPLAEFAGTPAGPNLITNANNGNWGDLSDGTLINNIALTNEYPGMLSGLNYNAAFPPQAGNVVYNNIATGFVDWWYMADHTTGMETGRMIVVDEANQSAVFFKETVALEANTHYALTMWIANMNKPSAAPPPTPPRIGITVVAADGTLLFHEVLSELPQTNPPQWTQTGGLFYNTEATSADITISAEGADPYGNDYAVDDIVLSEVDIAELTLEKFASQCPITIGEMLTYSVLISNLSDFAAKNVLFSDPLAANVIFVPGSVRIDDIPYDTYDPVAGFALADMEPGSSYVVTYQVIVDDNSVNPIPNRAESSYDVLVSQSGDIFRHTVYSNTVLTYITRCNLRQPATDLLESISLVQTALSHIMNAEGEKLQKAVVLDLSTEEAIRINESVANMTKSILVLEGILLSKAELIKPQISCG